MVGEPMKAFGHDRCSPYSTYMVIAFSLLHYPPFPVSLHHFLHTFPSIFHLSLPFTKSIVLFPKICPLSGSHKEGRRNFILNREEDGEDGSKRLKVRFNLEGPYGGAIVFAEVTKSFCPKNFVVYLCRGRFRINFRCIMENGST